MKQCPYCRIENTEESKFCAGCGSKLDAAPNPESVEAQEPVTPITPVSQPQPVQTPQDEWQTVGKINYAQTGQTPPPPPPPPAYPVQGGAYQQPSQSYQQAGFPPPPPYASAPQQPKKSGKGWLIGLLIGVVALIGICLAVYFLAIKPLINRISDPDQLSTLIVDQFPTDFFTDIETPVPTEDEVVEPGPIDTNPRPEQVDVPGFSPLFFDTFSPENGWYDSETEHTKVTIGNNRYKLNHTMQDSVYWQTSDTANASDVVVQIDTARLQGDPDSTIGIICRYVDDDNLIKAEVYYDGWVSIDKKTNGTYVRMVEKALKNLVADENTLSLACVGDDITLFVNGAPVAMAKDSSPMSGNMGFLVGNHDVENGITVDFSNFQAYEVTDGRQIKQAADLPFSQTYRTPMAFENPTYRYENSLMTENDANRMRFTENEFHKVSWEEGKFLYTMKTTNRFITGPTMDLNLADVHVSVDVPAFDHDAMVGVICRLNSIENYYGFAVAKDGWTNIFKYVNGEYDDLYGEYHEGVLPYGDNTVGATCIGNELTLLVNGQAIVSVTDGELTTGDAGLFAQSYEEAPVVVQFKNLVVERYK